MIGSNIRKKNTSHIRAWREEKDKIKRLSFELSSIEKKDIRSPEVIRRMMNIPNLHAILKSDAEFKRRSRI